MKDTKENHRKLHEIAELSAAANGKLDRTALDAALDEVLEATRKIGRVLDELLAKARR
ncbi:MAG TPA: hypothetical protein VEJ86_09020 [Candidatus Binataceae bacterium]|nr:hypothetical protein [Candidatus Binataceae bacterium]